MPLADLGIVRVIVGVSQSYSDDSDPRGSEGSSVNRSETSEEVPAAHPREAPYPPSNTPTAMSTGTGPRVANIALIEG